MIASQEITLALRLLRRNGRSGEIGLLAAAIVIAVASLTTVEVFTGRVEQALLRQSNQLLGADLTISSDRRLPPEFERDAGDRGLHVAHALHFPTMAVRGETSALVELKAVTDGYPLRGEMQISDRPFGTQRVVHAIPAPGEVWVDFRLWSRLHLGIGDILGIGQSKFRIVALLMQEPDSTTGFFNSLPRVLMNDADVPATGLVQRGSRVRYILYVAGNASSIAAYRTWARQRLAPWERIEDVRDARPEVRSALSRAGRFLGLAALLSVVIAAVAVALAARRFVTRHLDACAVMRCCGARRAAIVRLYAMQFLVLGSGAAAGGCLIGYLAQQLLAMQIADLIGVALPPPGSLPAAHGFATGMVLLAAFALPPLIDLGRVPTLRVLRRDLGPPGGWAVLSYLCGAVAIAGLVIWQAHDARLGVYVLGGFCVAAALSALAVASFVALLGRAQIGGVNWRYGFLALRRRAVTSVVQIVALGVGIMALLVLTLVRGDLLHSWQTTLRPDLPNRFIVNIQPDQRRRVADFFSVRGMTPPDLLPMVRARLIAINGHAVSEASYADDRAKRLVDREFNLSWATTLPTDNIVVAGQWWNKANDAARQLSVEDGLASTLGLKLGDTLTYDVAGNRFTATITSLRKVDWDSFRVNFFVLAPPALLKDYAASFVTSFYAPPEQGATLTAFVEQFPNVLVIDVAQILAQVQRMMNQAVHAVQFVFAFTLAAGLVVLYAAIAGAREEREYEAAVMRVLGARRSRVMSLQLTEFALMGALAGFFAAAGANALGYILAHRVLHVEYLSSPWDWALGIVGGAIGVGTAGWLGVRHVLDVPPLQTLQKTM